MAASQSLNAMPVQFVDSSGNIINTQSASGIVGFAIMGNDGTQNRVLSTLVGASGTTALNTLAVVPLCFGGTNYLPMADAIAAANANGAGIQAVAALNYSSSSFQRFANVNCFADASTLSNAGQASFAGTVVAPWEWNGASWDRPRVHTLAAATGSITTPTGIRHVAEAGSYFNASTSGQIPVKSGSGLLLGVYVTTKGGAGQVLTIYDGVGVGNPVIAVIDGTALGQWPFHARFTNGLTIAATGAAATYQATLVYD